MSKSSAKSNASIVNLIVTMVIVGFVFVLAAPSVQSTAAKAATTAEAVDNQGSMRNEVSRIAASGDLTALDALGEDYTNGLANIKKFIGAEKVAEAEAQAAPTLRFAKERTAALEAANPALGDTVIDMQDLAPASSTSASAVSEPASIDFGSLTLPIFLTAIGLIVAWVVWNLRRGER